MLVTHPDLNAFEIKHVFYHFRLERITVFPILGLPLHELGHRFHALLRCNRLKVFIIQFNELLLFFEFEIVLETMIFFIEIFVYTK